MQKWVQMLNCSRPPLIPLRESLSFELSTKGRGCLSSFDKRMNVASCARSSLAMGLKHPPGPGRESPWQLESSRSRVSLDRNCRGLRLVAGGDIRRRIPRPVVVRRNPHLVALAQLLRRSIRWIEVNLIRPLVARIRQHQVS